VDWIMSGVSLNPFKVRCLHELELFTVIGRLVDSRNRI